MDLVTQAGLKTALIFIEVRPDLFRDGFGEWLSENFGIWTRFESESDRVWLRGRRHYSANTIIEYLRHETSMRDQSDAVFKLNDKWTSSLARLYALSRPGRTELFEFRERVGGVVKAPPVTVERTTA